MRRSKKGYWQAMNLKFKQAKKAIVALVVAYFVASSFAGQCGADYAEVIRNSGFDGESVWCGQKLWYRQPARQWTEALPVGNGRLGAMVFGGIETEQLQFNEDTLWSGEPKDWNNPGAKELLPEVRRLIFQGRYTEADQLCKQMQGPYTESYQPMGNLYLDFDNDAKTSDYCRDLDLDRAVATVRYNSGDVEFIREVFSSFPDQVIVIRLSCKKPGQISFTARLDSQLHYRTETAGPDHLVLKGKCPKHVEPS